jgi:hypothetical protein
VGQVPQYLQWDAVTGIILFHHLWGEIKQSANMVCGALVKVVGISTHMGNTWILVLTHMIGVTDSIDAVWTGVVVLAKAQVWVGVEIFFSKTTQMTTASIVEKEGIYSVATIVQGCTTCFALTLRFTLLQRAIGLALYALGEVVGKLTCTV